MKERIDYWVDEALTEEGDPNEVIKKIAEKYNNEMNKEKLQRLVEAFNTKLFLEKKSAGSDLEESFPIVDPIKIAAAVIKNEIEESLPKESSLREVVTFEVPPPDMVVHKEMFKEGAYSSPVKNNYFFFKTSASKLSDEEKQFGTFREALNTQKAKDRIEANKQRALRTFTVPKVKRMLVDSLQKDINFLKDLASDDSTSKFSKLVSSPSEKLSFGLTLAKQQLFPSSSEEYKVYTEMLDKALDKNEKETAETIMAMDTRALLESILNSPEFENVNKNVILEGYRDATSIAPSIMKSSPSIVKRVLTNMAQLGTGLDPESAYQLTKLEGNYRKLLKGELRGDF